jgi:hypothetical protein
VQFNPELKNDDSFADVPTEQLSLLAIRLESIQEICGRIEKLNASELSNRATQSDIESIELDLWIRCGAPDASNNHEASSWLINTSWAGYIKDFSPKSHVVSSILEVLLDKQDVTSLSKLVTYSKSIAEAMHDITVHLAETSSWCSFLAHLIALNSLILKILCAINELRINRYKYF